MVKRKRSSWASVHLPASLRYELAAPLLLANELRWFAPDVFRDVDVAAQSAGTVSDTFGRNSAGRCSGDHRCGHESAVQYQRWQDPVFHRQCGTRECDFGRTAERVYSLTLPEMWDEKWVRSGERAAGHSRVERFDPPEHRFVAVARAGWSGALLLASICFTAVKCRLYCAWCALTWNDGEIRPHDIRTSLAAAARGSPDSLVLVRVAEAYPAFWADRESAMLSTVALALAGPVLSWQERKVALAVVADTSASLSPQDLAHEQIILRQIESCEGLERDGRDSFRPRAARTHGCRERFQTGDYSGSGGTGTNLEAPVRQALASLPAGMLHRILLISDGNENEGALTRAAWQAQRTGRSDRHHCSGWAASSADSG